MELDYTSNFSGNSSRRLFVVTYDVLESKKIGWYKSQRRMHQPFLCASSSDDGVAVNGTPQSRASDDDVEEMRAKLTGSLQDEYSCDELIQSLHDAARSFELALKKKISSSKLPWFSAAWLGVDRNAWVKTFSYQVYVPHFSYHPSGYSCTLVFIKYFLVIFFAIAQFFFGSFVLRLPCIPYYKLRMRFHLEDTTETRILMSLCKGGTA